VRINLVVFKVSSKLSAPASTSLSLESRLGLVRRHRRRNMLRQIGPPALAMSILLLGAISGLAAVR
jgi:hypothetical protein